MWIFHVCLLCGSIPCLGQREMQLLKLLLSKKIETRFYERGERYSQLLFKYSTSKLNWRWVKFYLHLQHRCYWDTVTSSLSRQPNLVSGALEALILWVQPCTNNRYISLTHLFYFDNFISNFDPTCAHFENVELFLIFWMLTKKNFCK